MPQYAYRCSECSWSEDQEHPLGQAPRRASCVCGAPMSLVIGAGVHIAPSALEGKGAAVREIDQRESRWDKDMPAYKRMRHRGMQPANIDGSAMLEDKCGDQMDVDYGRLYEQGVTRERVIEGKEQADEIMASGVKL